MTTPEGADLVAIAAEADVEILVTETVLVEETTVDGSVAELAYYEAELTSLRDAATTLDAAEHPIGR
jgi:hypothetical protein